MQVHSAANYIYTENVEETNIFKPEKKKSEFCTTATASTDQDELGDEAIGDGRWLVDLEASPHPDEVNLVAELPDEVLRLLDGHCRRPGNGTASWRPSAPGS
jgi:hypothetical protein